MDNLNFLNSFSKLTDKINKDTYPLATSSWAKKFIAASNHSDLVKRMDERFNKNSWSNLVKIVNGNNDFKKSFLTQMTEHAAKSYNSEAYRKLSSTGYWGDIAKYSFINSSALILQDERIKGNTDLLEDIEIINNTINEIENNPIEFFNNLFDFVKAFMEDNPAVKYSSFFILYLITNYYLPLILTTDDVEKVIVNQVYNYNVINNFDDEDVLLEINCNSAFLKNHPRDKSKNIYKLLEHDKIRVLKDSLKWAFVIKENSLESGWIRKEFLNLK